LFELDANHPIPIAVLGATGSVGQRFVQLLDRHPWFQVILLAASDRSAGQPYARACRWILPEPMPQAAAGLIVQPIDPVQIAEAGVRLVFSALPSDLANQVEPDFARAGMVVCSNASAYRKEADVPLLLPEVNPDHVELVRVQRQRRGWQGCIVTNPNCTSTGLTIALKALQDAFGLRKAFVVSLQALSGAGYPGVPSMDVLDNVLPIVAGEESKVEWEPRKMLGKLDNQSVKLADFVISAHTNRVAVSDGHLVCVSVELEKPPNIESAAHAFRSYQAPPAGLGLPSTPNPVILLRVEEDRPQPRQDRMTGQGMTTVIGRLRPDPLFHLKFVVLSHNTIRGAAGGSIYNAELLVQQKLI
jgi:aspartate-semialdehyde dehydrogenase